MYTDQIRREASNIKSDITSIIRDLENCISDLESFKGIEAEKAKSNLEKKIQEYKILRNKLDEFK